MAAVTLTAKLVDKVSAPANKATKSLDKMNKAAGRFDKGRRFKKAGDGLKRISRSSDEAASSLAKASMKGNLMANAIGAVASVAKEAALAILRLGVAFGAAVGRAASFGENLQFSLTRFLKSSSRAKKEIASVLALSNKLGLDFQKTATNFKDLVSAGFAPQAAKEMLKFKADLLAMGTGGPEASMKIDAAFEHIQKSMAKGRMEADSFNEILANLPITKMQIMDKLALKMGKSTAELMKMDVTKLPIKQLLASMQEAMLTSVEASKLGEMALKKQKSTVTGMIALVKARVGNIPDMIATRLEGSGLKTIMEDVLKALESDEAKAILDGIVAVLNEMAAAARKFWPILKSIMGALVSMGKTAMTFGDKAAKALGLSTGPAEMLAFALKSIAVVLTVIVGAATALGVIAATPFIILYKGAMLAIQGFMSLVQSIAGFVTQMKSGLTSLGTNMISGLVQGIKSGASAVISALGGVIDSAIGAAKAKLGIASPSKVFENMGAMSALGYEQGFDDVGASIPSMSASAVAPSVGGGGGNNVTQNNNNTFNVTEAQSAEETARMVKRMQLLEMANAFEQMAIEVGA